MDMAMATDMATATTKKHNFKILEMLNWYAIYVNAKHEKKVVSKLILQGITAYAPMVKKLQQWSDRKKWVELPMLSGYVFVQIIDSQKDKVLNSASVFSFIKFNGVEAKIRDSDIAILKSIEDSGYDVTQCLDNYKLFDEVEITQGQLKGLKGIVVLLQNTNFVQIQLESLNQNIKVKLPIHLLKVVSKVSK